MAAYPPPLPPGRLVDLPGRGRTWVHDSGGELPPVVLLHGWTSTAALTWCAAMGPLARHHRVIAPDLRGHGRGLPTRRFSLEACADDVAALVHELVGSPAVIAGYSMGGPVAQLMWRRHPALVRGLVLCATAARFPRGRDFAPVVSAVGLGLSALVSAIPGGWRRSALTRLVTARDPDPERARWVISEQARSDPAALVQAAAALNAFDSRPWVGEVDVPTSVLVTARDTVVPPERQWWLARAIPGAEATPLPAGHRAVADVPGRFHAAMLAALASVQRRAEVAGLRSGA